jgi:hypothetical protein
MTRTSLLLFIAVLTGVVAIELYPARTPEPTEPDSALGDAALTTSAQEFVAPDVSVFAEVLERPLFFQDRKLPPEPTPEPVATTPRLPLRLTLEGVAITSDSRVAVFRNTSNNQLLQLAEGMSHDGWLLESVSSAAVTFKRGAEVSELALDPNSRNGQR